MPRRQRLRNPERRRGEHLPVCVTRLPFVYQDQRLPVLHMDVAWLALAAWLAQGTSGGFHSRQTGSQALYRGGGLSRQGRAQFARPIN